MDARSIAEALTGKNLPRRDYYVVCCPCHDDKRPSLSISDGDKGLVVKCHTGCDPLDILAAIRRRVGTSKPSDSPGQRREKPEHTVEETLAYVEKHWRRTVPLPDTTGDRYLIKRKVDVRLIPDHGGFRWLRDCPWGERNKTGCIVARYSDALTGELRGLWRRPPIDGVKPMSLGPHKGCVIRLWPDEDVTAGLVIGEGPITAAAAALNIEHKGTLLQPAWAAGNRGNLADFPVLAGVDALTILVDADEPDPKEPRGWGQAAAAQCAKRWHEAGRYVVRLTPDELGKDFADLALREAVR